MKLFNHSQRGLLYSEDWPCQPIEAVLETLDGIGNNGWIKKQAHHIAKTRWDKAVSSALKVANDVEVSRWIATSGLDANDIISDNCIVKLKPDTFYEILGATAEIKTFNGANCSYAFLHLPQENKPEYANSDETPVERELSKLIAKHIMGWTLDPNKIEAVKKVANEFRSVKPENSDPFNHTDSLIKELEFVKTSNREICIELESLRKANRELKAFIEQRKVECQDNAAYLELEAITEFIQKHS